MKTSIIKLPAPTWYIVDAEGKTIGFLSSKIAHVLRGKHRPSFSPHQFTGDHIIVVNVEKLAVTQAKMRRKTYVNHTGYPGHIHTRSLKTVFEESPEEVIEKAVKGMLPVNRIRSKMLKNLHVLRGSEHKYAAQKPQPLDLSTF